MKFKLWNCDIKKIFKRLLPIALATTMVFSFVGCGSKEKDDQGNVEPNPPIVTPVDPDKEDPDKENPGTQTDPSKDPDDQDPDTPPVVEEFSLAENKDKILETFKGVAIYCARTLLGNSTTVEQVYDLSIRNENSNTIINTVYSGLYKTNSEYIQYATITFSNQILTYEQFAKNDLQLSADNIKSKSNYYFSMGVERHERYKSTIQTIQKKLFDNYDKALWLGWSGNNAPQYDGHQVVCYDGKQIKEIWINIQNDGSTLTFPNGPVEKYLINDEYTILNNYGTTITLPTDTLLAQVQKELQDKEQQEI